VPWLSIRVLRGYHARRYARSFGRRPNLERPRLFTEYILHRIVHDRDPLLKVVSDKIAVRRWIDAVVGEGFTVPLLGAWASADEIDWAALPIPFVLKPSHSSGPFRIVEQAVSAAQRQALVEEVSAWLAVDFFDVSLEWGYKGLPRRVTAEPLLRSADGASLIEVNVFAFHGQPRMLLAFTGHKHSETERCVMWIEASGARSDMWGSTALAHDVLGPDGAQRMADQVEAARPAMLELSRRIGSHFPYVRVDFYITDGGLKIGELTSYPAAGCGVYRPDDADMRLGRMLRDSGLARRAAGHPPYPWPPLD
jgi:hypothetical protein